MSFKFRKDIPVNSDECVAPTREKIIDYHNCQSYLFSYLFVVVVPLVVAVDVVGIAYVVEFGADVMILLQLLHNFFFWMMTHLQLMM